MKYDNSIFDSGLSYKAIGLYCYLAHFKSLSGMTQSKLVRRSGNVERTTAVRSGLNELKDSGFLSTREASNGTGHMIWRLKRKNRTHSGIANFKYWTKEQQHNYRVSMWLMVMIGSLGYVTVGKQNLIIHKVLNGFTPESFKRAIYANEYYRVVTGKKPIPEYKYILGILSNGDAYSNCKYWYKKLKKYGSKSGDSLSTRIALQWPYQFHRDWFHIGYKYGKQKKEFWKHDTDLNYINNHRY